MFLIFSLLSFKRGLFAGRMIARTSASSMIDTDNLYNPNDIDTSNLDKFKSFATLFFPIQFPFVHGQIGPHDESYGVKTSLLVLLHLQMHAKLNP